jgi:hypothetical protein
MNNLDKTFYKKLVDLYASRELPTELENELADAAANDVKLAADMETLRHSVIQLQSSPSVNYTEDTEYRILMKLQAKSGEDILTPQTTSQSWQYRLPMEG